MHAALSPPSVRDAHRALANTAPIPYWLDPAITPPPAPLPALTTDTRCDLLVVGGGYTGLWTALRAKERNPELDVVLVESHTSGWAASGRNGGFAESSLTHGLPNGLARWPDEMHQLERLGRENLAAIEATLTRYGIDCHYERTGTMTVATQPHQVPWLATFAEQSRRFGGTATVLDAPAARARINSPTFLGAVIEDTTALVDPARLARGLRETCLRLGVRMHEHTPATGLTDDGDALRVRTPYATVTAAKVALATNAFPSLLRRHRPFTVPVYDYALMTAPLSATQQDAVGWAGRQGLGDMANRFHYIRPTRDNRILFGGFDAIYHGPRVRAEYDQRPATFATLARQFFEMFPQLDGLEFSHAWGGAIDTCSRFSAFFDVSHGGRVAYSAGFTGLGVTSTRFAADVMLDLLGGDRTERTALTMVRRKPVPFPPGPLRTGVIGLTSWSLARADGNQGRRNLWLRALDALGVGFDS